MVLKLGHFGKYIIIIIGSTALGGSWPSQANVASVLLPGHPLANFYTPVSLCLPPRQSILILVACVLGYLQREIILGIPEMY